MCAEGSGLVLVVPLAPSRADDPRRCRPIGCYEAAPGLATQYRERPMTKDEPMTPEQEYDYYAQPDNQQPQGPPRRRQSRLSERVPVRFTPELLDQIRRPPKPTIDPCPHGSAAPPNTSSTAPHNLALDRRKRIRLRRQLPSRSRTLRRLALSHNRILCGHRPRGCVKGDHQDHPAMQRLAVPAATCWKFV